MLFLTIHHDFQWTLEAHMAHELRFLNGRHLVEDVLLQYAIACVGVDGEVAHAERCQVLEEVCAL